MDNHRRIWHKFVSRLRGSRRTHSYIPRSAVGSRNVSSTSLAVEASLPGRYSRFVRDNGRTRPRLQMPTNNGEWNFANSFARLGRFDKLVSFTPKCLTGFNAEPILSGQISYDDFSHNCWLENHLHRFGGLNADAVRNENSNSVTDSESEAQVHSETESIASCSRNDTSVPAAVSIWNSRRTDSTSNTFSSSASSYTSSSSTVSDVTHFYLTGFAFDPDSMFQEAPPPYSELHDDPPPPYTETLDSAATRSRNVSNQGLHFYDILW